MRDAHLRLDRESIPPALELSRRGARARAFAQEPVPARDLQSLMLFALSSEERARIARGGAQRDFVMEAEGLSSPAETVAYLKGRGEIAPSTQERPVTSDLLGRG